MPKRKKRKDKIRDTAEYQEMLAELKSIIEDASARGVPLFQRDDLLSCRACGACEDDGHPFGRVICDHARRVLGKGEFIFIDSKERTCHHRGICHCKITYDFICTACGARQEAIIRHRFEV